MNTRITSRKRAVRIALVALLLSAMGMTNVIVADNVPEGAVNGLFTINSSGTKVYFSQGNLQYQASTNTWRFAENQYEFVGHDNMYVSESYEGWIDLFGWGTSGYNHGATCYQPWSVSTTASHYSAYGNNVADLCDETGMADWGYNAISNGGNAENFGWRTLTKDEWMFILNTRTTESGIRFAKAIVNDVKGLILLPNNWNPSVYALNNTNAGNAVFTDNVISTEDWSTLEAAGAIFLPGGGSREGMTVSGYSRVTAGNAYGRYWSATHDDVDGAYGLNFSNYSVTGQWRMDRYLGISVRLAYQKPSISYNIEAVPNPEDGGTVSGDGVYEVDEICTLTATPNDDYIFVNWTMDGVEVSAEETYSFVVEADMSLVANFELKTFEIVAMAEPNFAGMVEGNGVYTIHDTCTLIATPATDYVFVNWTKDGEVVSTEATFFFEVTEAATYVANFELMSFVITATANPATGGNEVIVDGQTSPAGTYYLGTMCNLIAIPGEDFVFVNWTKDGEIISTDEIYWFNVVEDAAYVANFRRVRFDVAALANPVVGGVVLGGGKYNEGTSCALVAVPNEDYSFVSWTINGEVLQTTDTIYEFVVNANTIAVANFRSMTDIIQETTFLNGWTWWSSNIESEDGLFDQLKTGLRANGKQIKSQGPYVQYNEVLNMWLGNLTSMNNESTYMVQTGGSCTVTIIGDATLPSQHPITVKQGWNWIGYPCSTSMPVTAALSNITPNNGDQLKSQNSYTTYNSFLNMWVGNLNTLNPGMGLLYKSNNGQNIQLIYPDGTRSSELKDNVTPESNHWVPNTYAYPSNMTVTAVVDLDGMELQSENYEIAAFANGECRGSARLMYVEPLNRYMAFLLVSGDEDIDLSFSLYNVETGEECFETNAAMTYTTNAIVGAVDDPYVFNFRGMTAVSEFGSNMHIFPNPVERGQVVNLGANEVNGELTVEIINALGAVVSVEASTKLPATIEVPKTAGVYMLRITEKGKGTCYRKLVVK